MDIYCDESGNTGVDLLNSDQPLFALSSTSLAESTCRELVCPLLVQRQREAKYTRLKGTARGQRALLDLFGSNHFSPESTKLMLVDKRFYAITHFGRQTHRTAATRGRARSLCRRRPRRTGQRVVLCWSHYLPGLLGPGSKCLRVGHAAAQCCSLRRVRQGTSGCCQANSSTRARSGHGPAACSWPSR
ncbi:DUF3800 domain-containing protein (plasmid) [Hydrogenophaga sp. BPS33]|nr:DUF3800 domain-containing protein [Hydrogenophaga sp. BPS33]